MTKRLLFAALFALAIMASAQADPIKTRISGQLTDLGDSLLYNLIDMNLDSPRSVDKLATPDGKFDFTLDVEHPATFVIMDLAIMVEGNVEKMKYANLTIIPGEDVTINGSFDDYTIGGAEIYAKMKVHEDKMKEIFKGATRNNYDSLQKKCAEYAFEYIKSNPSDESAMVLVNGLNLEDLKKAVDLFSPEVRDGRMAGIWQPLVKMLEAQAKREEAAKKVSAGMDAIDFTLPDINGNPLALSSLRGKYVVLDFWGSWCSWCIKGIPDMKEYYAKYSGKFEILGIDCNDTEEKWKAAVEKHEIPWLHVRQSKETQDVSTDYGIGGFPTKILIDPEGKIVKVIVGEDPEFYSFLDKLFGE